MGAAGRRASAAYLADFGLARVVATGSRLTHSGEALGTPAYMSPEQARGAIGSLSPATDVWGLGVVLYEALAGRPPFEGDAPAALVGAVLSVDPPGLCTRRADVPGTVAAVARVALTKDLAHRYRDAATLRDDLDRVLRGSPPHARPPRRRATTLVAALLLAGGAAAAVWMAPIGRREQRPTAVPGAARAAAAASGAAVGLAERARSIRQVDPAQAADLLGRALAEAPGRHEWRLERGLLLWAVGRSIEARVEWERVPASDQAYTQARLYRALQTLLRHQGAEIGGTQATRELEEVVALGGPSARVASGALEIARGQWIAARERLRGELGWIGATLRATVESLAPEGDRREAIREFDAAVAEGLPHAWVHFARGLQRQNLGDLRGAMEDFEVAIRLQPEFAEAYGNRGNARAQLGDRDGAIADLDTAIGLDPGYAMPRSNRGALRAQAGDLDGALADFAAALRLDPGLAFALAGRGMVRATRGEFAGALADLDAALRREPGHPEFLVSRGHVRRDLGDLEGALADYRAARAAAPQDGRPRAHLGNALPLLGRLADACAEYRAFLAAHPEHPLAPAVRRALAQAEAGLAAPPPGGG